MKTLDLIQSHLRRVTEQDQAAPPVDPTETGTDEVSDAPVPLTSEGEKYLIDLLVKAFAHSPDDNELKIIDNIAQQYRETNPKEISDAIQRLLDGGNEEFENTLSSI